MFLAQIKAIRRLLCFPLSCQICVDLRPEMAKGLAYILNCHAFAQT